ncbi:MAG: dihydrolipoyl dehydrogenase [Ignavibacteriae bacterium]|nr:dihydrolipoyl dehydrogenase [Ignavibacteriota bacterium]
MNTITTDVVVIGAGPGGYAAAFYAADKGKSVVLVERDARLGGVCLNRGCIPSKALLHAAKLIDEAKESSFRGIHFAAPRIDLNEMRTWKDSVIEKLAGGVRTLAQKRGVQVLEGKAHFEDSRTLRVETASGQQFITFGKAIVAVGSRPAMPPAFDLGNPRVMTSTEALEIEEIPEKLLVVGGGYIGMELGTVYATLGSDVIVVEALPAVLAGADQDLVRPVLRRAAKLFKEVRTSVKVLKMATSGKQIKVDIEMNGEKRQEMYDRVLVSVGRAPNCADMGIENTKIVQDEKGYIKVDTHQQTGDPNILAIGDVVGGVMLAHKASKEARIAVEAIMGEDTVFENIIIPAVVFTDPEIAWAGMTEAEAKAANRTVEVVKFPWTASGRALSFDRTDGMTKLIIDPETERILGAGIVGAGAGELIGEAVVAMEMGATAYDMSQSVHPHPTLSETWMECAEAFYGHATHVMGKKKA